MMLRVLIFGLFFLSLANAYDNERSLSRTHAHACLMSITLSVRLAFGYLELKQRLTSAIPCLSNLFKIAFAYAWTDGYQKRVWCVGV